MIINHRDQEMEVLVLNNEFVFPNLGNELKRAIHNVDLKITKPFITRLKIAFSLEDHFYPKSWFKDYPFGLIDNEIFSVVGFIVPKISL